MVHKDVSRKNSERVESEGFLLSPSSSLPLITLLTFFLVSDFALHSTISGVDLGGWCRGTHPPSPLRWPESFYYNWYSVLKFVYVTSQFRHSEYLEEANLPGVRIVYNFIWPGVADELTTVWVKILAIPGVYLAHYFEQIFVWPSQFIPLYPIEHLHSNPPPADDSVHVPPFWQGFCKHLFCITKGDINVRVKMLLLTLPSSQITVAILSVGC